MENVVPVVNFEDVTKAHDALRALGVHVSLKAVASSMPQGAAGAAVSFLVRLVEYERNRALVNKAGLVT